MQIANTFHNGRRPPSQGGDALTPDIANQLRSQRLRYRRTLLLRTLDFWWYRILLVAIGGYIATILGRSALDSPREVFGGIIALPLLFLAIRRWEFGLLLTAILAVSNLPPAFSVKSLAIYPVVPLLLLLFFVVVLQIAFRAKKPVLPSFCFIWPLLALIVTALLSDLLIQITWTPGVPHKLNNNPAIYEEMLGIALFFLPLICLVVTTASLTKKDQWIEYIQRAFLILALGAAMVVIIDFKRVGVDVYTFRFAEPTIGWMNLSNLAPLMGLGSIIAYARLLYANGWRIRCIYGGVLLICLVGLYLTLYNSEWIEIAVALVVMTLIYSFRLFLSFCVALLPFLPLLKSTIDKLSSVKSDDFIRLNVWQDALRVWSKQPWLGVGPGNFWIYDQYFTQLPLTLHNFNTTGLGVAHNGYLQILGELGPIGLFFWFSLIIVIIIAAARLYRRSNRSEARNDRMLALVGLGLILGSAVADFVSGSFILPPRQVGSFSNLPLVLASWIIFGCIAYKDQLWRKVRNSERLKIQADDDEVPPTTGLLEEQATWAMPASSGVKLQGRLLLPKFSLKQREGGWTGPQAASEQRGRALKSLVTEKAMVTSASNTASFAEDGRLLQNYYQIWRPGTFGFTNEDSHEWAETSVPPRSIPSDSAETVNSDSAPSTLKSGHSVVIQMLSWAIPIPIIFPMTALLTRYLGPAQYGEYSFTLTYVGILSLLTGTGMDSLIVRQLSRQPRKEWSQTLGYAAGTRLVSTLLSIGAGALLALVLPISAEQRNLLLLGSVSLLFSFSANGLRMIYSNGFRAEQRIGILSLIQTVDRVVTAGLVALVVLLHLPLLWAFMLIIYSDLPFFIVLVIIARRRFGVRLRFTFARARELLLGSLPLMGYDMLTFISGQVDLLILMMLAGAQSVGLYALASRITDPLISIALAYMLGLYPLFCAKFGEGREQFVQVYQQSARIVALCIIPLAIYVSVEAGALVALLGGHGFAAATIALQLLMWAMVATFFNQLAARTCMAANMDRRISYVTFIATAANVLVNLALIPLWGIVGAGLAALISELVGLCLFLVLLRGLVPLLRTLGIVVRVFLGNLPALAFLLWQQGRSPLLTVPVALLLTIVGCMMTRTLSLKDVHVLWRILYARRDKEASKDISDRPAAILSKIEDIADWPTAIIPKLHI